jgi:hypothetical protein
MRGARSEAQMRRVSAKARHSGGAMATAVRVNVTVNSPSLATQNQSQDRTEWENFARQVNQRPLGEIFLEKVKDKK